MRPAEDGGEFAMNACVGEWSTSSMVFASSFSGGSLILHYGALDWLEGAGLVRVFGCGG